MKGVPCRFCICVAVLCQQERRGQSKTIRVPLCCKRGTGAQEPPPPRFPVRILRSHVIEAEGCAKGGWGLAAGRRVCAPCSRTKVGEPAEEEKGGLGQGVSGGRVVEKQKGIHLLPRYRVAQT